MPDTTSPALSPAQAVEIRLRTRIPREELEQKVGKILLPNDLNVVLTGPARVLKPDGSLLCVYVPRAIPEAVTASTYPTLHTIRDLTDNRGLASGSVRRKTPGGVRRAAKVMSSVVGYMDRYKNWHPYCRTTAWTGEHTERFRDLYPLFEEAAKVFEAHVPDRFAVQQARAEATNPAWRITKTPYTTVTVNNTYPTGVHKDVGDLHEGFSNLIVVRRGQYQGGWLTFPEWRVGVDLKDGDMLLMDAHEWHGNTVLQLDSEDAERISVVLYYRTDMIFCGTPEEEIDRAKQGRQLKVLKEPPLTTTKLDK